MTKQKPFFAATIFTLLCVAFISSCKKPGDKLPLEPITIQKPDSVVTFAFADSTIPIQVAVTTDRPINWIMCVYDIDTSITTPNYVPAYPDTLFVKNLQNFNPQVNLYTDTSSYHIPDWLVPFSIVRFKVSFQAGSNTATYGQNYPVGEVSAEKEFLINIQ